MSWSSPWSLPFKNIFLSAPSENTLECQSERDWIRLTLATQIIRIRNHQTRIDTNIGNLLAMFSPLSLRRQYQARHFLSHRRADIGDTTRMEEKRREEKSSWPISVWGNYRLWGIGSTCHTTVMFAHKVQPCRCLPLSRALLLLPIYEVHGNAKTQDSNNRRF